MRKMEHYIGRAYGYLVCKPWPNPWTYDEGDGGDSAQKTGLNRFFRYLKFRDDKDQLGRETAKLLQEMDGLEDPNRKNYYRRHPDPSYWWSRSSNFTRDQQRSLVIACGALGLKKRLLGMLWAHICRFGFYQNNRHPDESLGWKMPDVAAPNHWGEYVRAIYMLGGVFKLTAVLWPLLLVTDVFAFIGTLLERRKWADPNEADDDNQIMSTLQARVALPTPVSFLHRRYYIHNRPLAGFIDPELGQRTLPIRNAPGNRDMTGVESCLWWKHHEINQGPPYYETYNDVLKKYLRD